MLSRSLAALSLLLLGTAALAQPWSAGVDVFAPVQPALPLARGIDTEHSRTYAFAARVGRKLTPQISVGGSAGYRYSESLNTLFADPNLLIEDKLTTLSAGPFVRYERPLGPLAGIGEFAIDGGLLLLGGKTQGLGFHEATQNYTGFALAATPRLGLAYAPAGRFRLELLAGYRFGYASIGTMIGEEEEPCTVTPDYCGPRFDWRRVDHAGTYGGLDVSLGVRYAWHPPRPREASSPVVPGRHAFYAEAGGSGIFYSLNYEHDLGGAPGGLHVRIGGSVLPPFPGSDGGFALGTVALGAVPSGEVRRFVPEISAGLVAVTSDSEVVPTVSAGFRLVRPRWFARFVVTAFQPKDRRDYATGRETLFLPGVSVGVPL
ncbi:MAG: hypothetical protein ABJF88_15025 [Rhodothermales bacterium]